MNITKSVEPAATNVPFVEGFYIPPTVVKSKTNAQRRIGIQGPASGGKTYSALTFPNPLVLDFDNGLTAHPDVDHVPFYDPEFIGKYNPNFKPKIKGTFPNRRDALLKWLEEDALKLHPEQTLIIDSWTTVQSAFDQQQELEPKATKSGGIDEYDFWAKKIDFSRKVSQYLCSVKCNVVVTLHETAVRDIKTGQLLEKISPLMQGKFLAELKIYYTDFFRMVNEEEKKEGKVVGCKYFWQVRSDSNFDAKCRLPKLPLGMVRIPATYESIQQYGS